MRARALASDVARRLHDLYVGLGTFAVAGLVIALLFGGALRFAYPNWDDGGHLHPDERYISTVANDIRLPSGPIQYFDVRTSPLSPYNTQSGRSYVYGIMPLTASKLVASLFDRGDYDHVDLVARHLSALLDTMTIALVFVLGLMLMDELGRRRAANGAAIAALFYAFTVTAIQHAHFFTVDSWLVFFSMVTILVTLWALRASRSSAARLFNPRFAAVGAAAGLTVACKVPGALVLAPVGVGIAADASLVALATRATRGLLRFVGSLLVLLFSAYLAFRFVSPYDFASSNWLNVRLAPGFQDALQDEFRRVGGKFLYPPSYQWLLSTPVVDPLRNLIRWQLGIPLGILALIGVGVVAARVVTPLWGALRRGVRRPEPQSLVGPTTSWLIALTYVLVVFLWIAPRFAHMGRYLVPITPLLAIAAAYALVRLCAEHRALLVATATTVVLLTGLYALAYEHVLAEPHTRMVASAWIAAHAPAGSSIANEHWDDSLPVGGAAAPYRLYQLPVFEPDDATKLTKLYDILSRSDYYVLSSPRAWRTIGRLPDRFPLMARFYQELFAGKLGFRKVATFESEPQLLGIKLHDLSAEEAFWVYDHPPVMIYRRTGPLDLRRFRATLCPRPNAACPAPEN